MARVAEHAIVIGAGMGGLAAAAAAAPFFERVTVLERDALPDAPDWRIGTPQCRHAHFLLTGGLKAMEALVPGIGDALEEAGAVRTYFQRDLCQELPGHDPLPRRDLDLPRSYSMTRPLLERTLRRRIEALSNVTVRDRTRVSGLSSGPAGAVAGVRIAGEGGAETVLAADVVIDASGRGQPTLAHLAAVGLPPPDEEVIGINATYTSALVAKPDGWTDDWLAAATLPRPPEDRLGAFLFSVENRCWLASIQEMHGDPTPTDWAGLLAGAKALRTPTVYEAIKDAQPVSEVTRYRRVQSTFRHFERYPSFPRGLIPFGDVICQFNPVYGQGITSAALQALALKAVLAEKAAEPEPLAGLSELFLARRPPETDGFWAATRGFDLLFPGTTGERPADFEMASRFNVGLLELAARDPATHRLFVEVAHGLTSPAAYQDPALGARVMQAYDELMAAPAG
jgi:2-polyprenyl-6-methoxyphenol hydroxylase-like FAD-dependent oxidoreductase